MPGKRKGAICKDGTYTTATGRGAGSHHGGVKEWIYQQSPAQKQPATDNYYRPSSSSSSSGSSSFGGGIFGNHSYGTNIFGQRKQQPHQRKIKNGMLNVVNEEPEQSFDGRKSQMKQGPQLFTFKAKDCCQAVKKQRDDLKEKIQRLYKEYTAKLEKMKTIIKNDSTELTNAQKEIKDLKLDKQNLQEELNQKERKMKLLIRSKSQSEAKLQESLKMQEVYSKKLDQMEKKIQSDIQGLVNAQRETTNLRLNQEIMAKQLIQKDKKLQEVVKLNLQTEAKLQKAIQNSQRDLKIKQSVEKRMTQLEQYLRNQAKKQMKSHLETQISKLQQQRKSKEAKSNQNVDQVQESQLENKYNSLMKQKAQLQSRFSCLEKQNKWFQLQIKKSEDKKQCQVQQGNVLKVILKEFQDCLQKQYQENIENLIKDFIKEKQKWESDKNKQDQEVEILRSSVLYFFEVFSKLLTVFDKSGRLSALSKKPTNNVETKQWLLNAKRLTKELQAESAGDKSQKGVSINEKDEEKQRKKDFIVSEAELSGSS